MNGREYESRYRRYCEQVEYLSGQVDSLLGRLDKGGMLEGMTVVIHGDHGSRIRRLLAGTENKLVMPDVFDYGSEEPEIRDLLDRFSTLLAVKQPGADAPAVNEEKHSLMTFLPRQVYGREPEDGVAASDRVYLVNSQGKLQGIDILKYWR